MVGPRLALGRDELTEASAGSGRSPAVVLVALDDHTDVERRAVRERLQARRARRLAGQAVAARRAALACRVADPGAAGGEFATIVVGAAGDLGEADLARVAVAD